MTLKEEIKEMAGIIDEGINDYIKAAGQVDGDKIKETKFGQKIAQGKQAIIKRKEENNAAAKSKDA
jgi:hypothetical protein